ncbi:tetratricopeptide repeat protein [Candidatus Poribacteria bacterium]|nr:tetratricopeptide repeat protein [Candidatus Poribacteria bacterium]MYK17017.1 tetratricopeptide repeat protein [Candidatus Poribacteria bacterium]
MEERMLFNYDETDDFEDEPQELSPNEEDDFSENEGSPETESEVIETEGNDDSNESDPYDRIAEILGKGELEEISAPLTATPQGSVLFQLYEQSSHAYANAVTAYYEEKNYQQAIEKFDEAIENASERAAHDLTEEQANEIVAKSMYWQAEAYVKTENIPQAIETFRALIQNCQGHYLTLAAQRRTDELNTK